MRLAGSICFFSKADIVFLPSYREGIPLALIEAAACGLPIVATDVPGCREVVVDRHNGFLVEVKKIKPLAEALEKLLSSDLLRKKMGDTSRKRAVDLFEKEKVVADNLDLYGEITEHLKKSA